MTVPDAIASSLLAGPALAGTLKIAAFVAGFGLGVRLLAVGGGTADDRDRVLVEAARGRPSTSKPADGAGPVVG